LVTVSFVIPVPSSFNWTDAPGTTASDASVTVPLIAPVTLTCAKAVEAAHTIAQARRRMTLRIFMVLLVSATWV
jgi:hypothetical protein